MSEFDAPAPADSIPWEATVRDLVRAWALCEPYTTLAFALYRYTGPTDFAEALEKARELINQADTRQ